MPGLHQTSMSTTGQEADGTPPFMQRTWPQPTVSVSSAGMLSITASAALLLPQGLVVICTQDPTNSSQLPTLKPAAVDW